MPPTEQVCQILRSTLGLGRMRLTEDTLLLGSLPELDSMVVANLIIALEDQFGFQVRDDEMNASHFATVGSLSRFVQSKLD